MKTTCFRLLAASLSLAMTLTISSCASGKNYAIPEDKRRTYDETVEVPDVSAEELFKKVKLYLIDRIDDSYFEDENYPSKIKEVFNEGNKHIVFKPIRERADAAFTFSSKKTVTKVEVFVSDGQYRVVGSAIDSVKAKEGEFDKELDKLLSEMDGTWKAFADGMKKAVTIQFTDADFEILLEQGRRTAGTVDLVPNPASRVENFEKAGKIFSVAAAARPNDVKALFNYGMCLQNGGSAEIDAQMFISGGKPPLSGKRAFRVAAAKLNKALFVYELVPPGDQESGNAISTIQQLKSKIGW